MNIPVKIHTKKTMVTVASNYASIREAWAEFVDNAYKGLCIAKYDAFSRRLPWSVYLAKELVCHSFRALYRSARMKFFPVQPKGEGIRIVDPCNEHDMILEKGSSDGWVCKNCDYTYVDRHY